jgi:chlorophyll(ide) b reductase
MHAVRLMTTRPHPSPLAPGLAPAALPQPFIEQAPEVVDAVVRTNLLGSLLCTRAALRLMAHQPRGGHVFLTEGAGSDGMSTPQYAAYGATKAGLAQLARSLQHEAAAAAAGPGGGGGRVGVHSLSPGMVLTDLLLEGATPGNKAAFNILCEHPEVVAAYLVPRARSAVARGAGGATIRYLTPARALGRLLTAPWRLGRFFDAAGQAVYPLEAERLGGLGAKRTARATARAARRGTGLSLAYGASIAAAYLILMADQVAKAHG